MDQDTLLFNLHQPVDYLTVKIFWRPTWMATVFQAIVHSNPRLTGVEKFNSLLDDKVSRTVSELIL